MTAKQIQYFGTARQKAALKNRSRRRGVKHLTSYGVPRQRHKYQTPKYLYKLKSSERRGRYSKAPVYRRNQGFVSRAEHAAEDAIRDVERAAEDAIGDVTHAVNRGRRNVGQILTVLPANPGRRRRKNMARTRNRRRVRRATNRSYRRRNRVRRNRNPLATHHRRRRRYARNPKVVVRYRNRRHNRRNQGRRRNPNGWLTGDAGAVVGLLGGAAVTNIIKNFLPANLATGWPGYISTGIVAVVSGQLIGRMTSNTRLGNWVTIGGLLIVGLQIANDLFPQLALPFTLTGATPATAGTAGMGLITSSNFFVPQVNLPGSMATFVRPAAIPAPVVVPATGMNGLGVATSSMNQGLRRIGRLR